MTRRADHDCVLAVVVFFLPILPLRPLHTFDWVGQQCRTAPIRWSLWLVIRSLLRPWLIAVLAVALVAAVLYLVPSLGREVVGRRFLTKYDEGLWVALGSIAGSALGLSLLGEAAMSGWSSAVTAWAPATRAPGLGNSSSR